MHLGCSSECINPATEVELCGYGWYINRKATGVLQDIYVRALFLKDNENLFLIINYDLLALDHEFANNVKLRLSGLLPIKRGNILLLSTHTHTSPAVIQTIGCGTANQEYIKQLFEKTVLAGVRAYKTLYSVSSIDYGKHPIEPFCQNRRVKNGPTDPDVYAVRFNLDGQKPYYLVHYACHPVANGVISEISPDYPGFVVSTLKSRGYNGMFLTGCCGDIDPTCKIERGGGTIEEIAEYGDRIASAADIALINTNMNTEIKSFDFSFRLETEAYTPEYADILFNIIKNEHNTEKKAAAKEWLAEMEAGSVNTNNVIYVQVLKIGKILLIGTPGEITAGIGASVRAAFPESFMLICENANGAIRYIASDKNIADKEYEGFWSNIIYRTFPLKQGAEGMYISSITKKIKESI